MDEAPVFETQVQAGTVPGGAVGISVVGKTLGNFALVREVKEFLGVFLLDVAVEEAGNIFGLDAIGVGGGDCGFFSV
jgi:hypothetical protein